MHKQIILKRSTNYNSFIKDGIYTFGICPNGLDDYFEVPCSARKLIVNITSDRPSHNEYFKIKRSHWYFEFDHVMLDGFEESPWTGSTDDVLNRILPKSFNKGYAYIEYE